MNWLNYTRGKLLYPLIEKTAGRDISSKLRQIDTLRSLSLEQRAAYLHSRLLAVVETAQRHVPYYRHLFRRIGFDARDLRANPLALKHLPHLTKEDLLEHGPQLLNETIDKNRLFSVRTGGSTGPTAVIYYDRSAADWSAAANRFVLALANRPLTKSEAHLSTRFPEAGSLRDRLREWVKCQAMNRTNLKTDSLDPESLENLWETLQRVRPFLLQGHPSTVYALAKHLEDRGPQHGIIAAFESTGETMDMRRFETIQKIIGCQIFNRYGSAEFGVVAHSHEDPFCLPGLEFMVHPESIELGNGLREMVFTNLNNFAMPLIRYRTGDVGDLQIHDDGFTIKSLRGRIHDFIEIGTAKLPSHYIMDILNRRGDVDDFQFIVRKGSRPELRVVTKKGAPIDDITATLRRIFDEQVDLRFVNQNQLELSGWRDKYRYVVQKAEI